MKNQEPRFIGSIELALLAILFVGRLFVLLAAPAGLSGDAFGYVNGAKHIVSQGYLPPLRVQPHGLSLLITPLVILSGDSVARAMLCVNVAMDTAVVLSLVFLARRLFAPPRSATVRLAACATIMMQPFTATMATSVYTEQFCQFFLFFGVRSLYGSFSTKGLNRASLIGPLFLGAAALLRSELLLLSPLILFAYFLLEARRRNSLYALLRAAVIGTVAFGALLVSMLAYQHVSTGEIGFVRPEFYNRGYMAWMRTWFATEADHNRFAFGPGKPDWAGFDMDKYPQRAFDSVGEKEQVRELLHKWRLRGYTDPIENAFLILAKQKSRQHPFRQYLWNPIARMCCYWINSDGAQVVLRTLPIRRPISTALVGATLSLRVLLILLAVIGLFAVWLRHRQFDVEVSEIDRARLGSVTIILRTLLLGVLGAFVWAGLMEIRYVSIVFPFLIVLSLFGACYGCGCVTSLRDRTPIADD